MRQALNVIAVKLLIYNYPHYSQENVDFKESTN